LTADLEVDAWTTTTASTDYLKVVDLGNEVFGLGPRSGMD